MDTLLLLRVVEIGIILAIIIFVVGTAATKEQDMGAGILVLIIVAAIAYFWVLPWTAERINTSPQSTTVVTQSGQPAVGGQGGCTLERIETGKGRQRRFEAGVCNVTAFRIRLDNGVILSDCTLDTPQIGGDAEDGVINGWIGELKRACPVRTNARGQQMQLASVVLQFIPGDQDQRRRRWEDNQLLPA